MDEHPNRPALIVVALFLIAGSIVAGTVLLGGQTSHILSTVGGAVGNSVGAAPGGGDDTEDPDAQSGSGSGDSAGGSDSGGPGSGGQVADAAATVPTLLIIRTGELKLEVRDLGVAVQNADAAVLRAGGYVSESVRLAKAEDESASVTYRIPSARWDATLETLRELASKVDGEQVSTEEVTGQVVDLTARIANLRATEAALQAIMAKAAKISDVLDVQDQLTTTRGEIEQLVAKKEHLEDQAAFGSLKVTLHLPVIPAPAATPAPVPGWDPGTDVARASAKLVRIGQTSTSIAIWLAIVGLPLALAAIVATIAGWQAYRLGRWLVRRRDRLLGV